jgi:hypothetical protein
MKINSDINIIGSLPDFNLIRLFMDNSVDSLTQGGGHNAYTAIKTEKSVKRFERAINRTLLHFNNPFSKELVDKILVTESISNDSLLILFWNASVNNDLLGYLNDNVYLPAFYSGRVSINQKEVVACLQELKETESDLKDWADSTIEKVASKYLTLLKKFGLMEGGLNKTIVHPYLSDKMLILYVYWLLANETKANLLESPLMKYCFSERQVFIERIAQKKFAKYINLYYSGDKLKIEPVIPYSEIYDSLTRY